MEDAKKHPRGGWYCPNKDCNEWTLKLITSGNKTYCPLCRGANPTMTGINLHDDVGDGTTKVTRGKAWEISNRVISKDDGRTVINKITGRPAQR
jgi:hypothetical protein